MNIIITGGAGFIGCNVADYMAARACEITVIDNLSRPGAAENLSWLRERNRRLRFLHADIRNASDLGNSTVRKAFAAADAIYHLAGQVAVTRSVVDPVDDFMTNALGTLNIVEALRAYGKDRGRHATLIFASTNKVYGCLASVRTETSAIGSEGGARRWELTDCPLGIPETTPLDFHSPYGCSKGYADQYVRDVSRPDIFDMKTVVFRQSCIYGPRQFGIEDQGWVAWFTIASVYQLPVTVYGDGMQTRDVLFVEDLARAFEAATTHIDRARGRIFNIGGGPPNAMSINELLMQLEKMNGRKIEAQFAGWRPGDQKCFVCDTRLAKNVIGWEPSVPASEGVARLRSWVVEMRERNPDFFNLVHS